MSQHKIKVLMKPGKGTIGPTNYGISISKHKVEDCKLLGLYFEEIYVSRDVIILTRNENKK